MIYLTFFFMNCSSYDCILSFYDFMSFILLNRFDWFMYELGIDLDTTKSFVLLRKNTKFFTYLSIIFSQTSTHLTQKISKKKSSIIIYNHTWRVNLFLRSSRLRDALSFRRRVFQCCINIINISSAVLEMRVRRILLWMYLG